MLAQEYASGPAATPQRQAQAAVPAQNVAGVWLIEPCVIGLPLYGVAPPLPLGCSPQSPLGLLAAQHLIQGRLLNLKKAAKPSLSCHFHHQPSPAMLIIDVCIQRLAGQEGAQEREPGIDLRSVLRRTAVHN